jgi:transaldolase
MTLCFSPNQAVLAALNGAKYISPFIGRLDDIGIDGLTLIEDIKMIYDNYQFSTEILAASVRNINHITEIMKIGVNVITMPSSLIEQLYKHILTDKGLEIFLKDWNK